MMPFDFAGLALAYHRFVLPEMNKEDLKKHYEPLIAEKRARIA